MLFTTHRCWPSVTTSTSIGFPLALFSEKLELAAMVPDRRAAVPAKKKTRFESSSTIQRLVPSVVIPSGLPRQRQKPKRTADRCESEEAESEFNRRFSSPQNQAKLNASRPTIFRDNRPCRLIAKRMAKRCFGMDRKLASATRQAAAKNYGSQSRVIGGLRSIFGSAVEDATVGRASVRTRDFLGQARKSGTATEPSGIKSNGSNARS